MRLGRDDTGRWKITPDRYEDIGRMKLSRTYGVAAQRPALSYMVEHWQELDRI